MERTRDITKKMCPFSIRALDPSAIIGGPAKAEVVAARCLGEECAAYVDNDCAQVTAPLFLSNNVAVLSNALQSVVVILKAVAEKYCGIDFGSPPPSKQ